jgi:hypothetical protein
MSGTKLGKQPGNTSQGLRSDAQGLPALSGDQHVALGRVSFGRAVTGCPITSRDLSAGFPLLDFLTNAVWTSFRFKSRSGVTFAICLRLNVIVIARKL